MTSHDGGGGGGGGLSGFFDRVDAWLEEMERRFTDWLDRLFGREDSSEAPAPDPSGEPPAPEQPNGGGPELH